jgi:hypothetical protein
MNKMKQYLLILILVVYSSVAYCCSCIGEATIKQELKRSDVVFIGKVIAKKVINTTDTLMPAIIIQKAEYKLQVSIIFKGKIKQDTIIVVTGLGGGDCGFNFEVGNEYIVYSSFENKYYPQGNTVNRFLYTDICRRTRLATDMEEIKALNKKCRKKKILSSP